MTTLQIIGIVAVAVLGLVVFYCLYDASFSNRKRKGSLRKRNPEV